MKKFVIYNPKDYTKLGRHMSASAIKSIAVVMAIAATSLLGLQLLPGSHAATGSVSSEPENGTITSPAASATDITASAGKAVTFGAAMTPTPPPGGGTACNATSTVKPVATNTGATVSGLTVVNGNVNVTTAGTTIANEDIHGFLDISASNVTVRNTIVRGGTTSSYQGFVNINSGTGILLDHITVLPTTKQVSVDGVWGNNFTLLCSDVSGGVDGMKIDNNTTIKNNYIHGLAYFSSDPSHGGGETHNDGIQILIGTNILIQGNNMPETNQDNSAVQITQDYGTVSNVTMQNNWMDGGGCTMNIAHTSAPLTKIFAYNNRFGRGQGFSGCAILISTKTTLTASGNVFDDNGQAISIQQHD